MASVEIITDGDKIDFELRRILDCSFCEYEKDDKASFPCNVCVAGSVKKTLEPINDPAT